MFKTLSNREKWIKITLHAIVWMIIILIPLYLNSVFGSGNLRRLYESYLYTFSAGVIFYTSYLWLVPKYFLQERKLIYVLFLFGLILVSFFFVSFVKEYFIFDPADEAKLRESLKRLPGQAEHSRAPKMVFDFMGHSFSSLLVAGFAVVLGLMEKLKLNEKKQKEMEKEKLHSELAFLKNQISPHFFFNTLNNIYSLIGIDGPAAQDSVLKLSKMMRYLLYESDHGETMMSHELEFMNNYIDLMKLRQSKRVDLQVDFPNDFSDFSVPPLLFIPFIENSFKHGVCHRETSVIKLRMEIDSQQIRFTSENSIGKGAQSEDMKQHSGIGLENVKKRLGLLFPGKHELKIEKDDTAFKVELIIQKVKINT